VPEVVPTEPRQPGCFDRGFEAAPDDVADGQRCPGRRGEDGIGVGREVRGEPMLSEHLRERGMHGDITLRRCTSTQTNRRASAASAQPPTTASSDTRSSTRRSSRRSTTRSSSPTTSKPPTSRPPAPSGGSSAKPCSRRSRSTPKRSTVTSSRRPSPNSPPSTTTTRSTPPTAAPAAAPRREPRPGKGQGFGRAPFGGDALPVNRGHGSNRTRTGGSRGPRARSSRGVSL
jgi:hypothetical protein